jgi:hypothetical protein
VDIKPLDLIRKVWQHSGVTGHVWMPHIYKIGVKDHEKFREGPVLSSRQPEFPELRDSVDWYWTPAVSSDNSRKAKAFPGQRAVWVDCDESFDDELLEALKPSFMWETSPGHKQAIWLLKDRIAPKEFHRDGFIGMLTQALGGDKSGVDIGQLLRVPGTWHHKREPFEGRILRSAGTVYTRGQLLTRVAKGLGFAPGLASELGADDPYGDRSKLLWKFSRNAAELGLDQELTFKLIKATKWNKWQDEPERLKEDIARAYDQQPEAKPVADPEKQQAIEQHDAHDGDETIEAWHMATVDTFGPVIRKPVSWVVPGIIPEAGCGLLVSAPKVGKTRIAIEMALGLATGRKPLGIQLKKPVPVGFLSLEDGEYLFADRLSTGMRDGRARYHWDGHIKQDGKQLVWEPPQPMDLFTNFAQVDLSDNDDKQRLYETIEKYGLKLVIIDTLSMAIGKSDVSNSKEMYAILKDIKTIAKATGCAIMFIHHTRKRMFEKGETIQEMVLGSTALHAWSDFIMNLVAPSEEVDFLRLGVQTKMGNHQHYIDSHLKIIKKPTLEEVEA